MVVYKETKSGDYLVYLKEVLNFLLSLCKKYNQWVRVSGTASFL